MERIYILEQLFDIIKFIGKQNLSYWGSSEALYNIENSNFNHGNFLERDMVLNKYLSAAIQRSEQRKQHMELNSKGSY